MELIQRGIRTLVKNPWLLVFIGIPFLAIAWLAANYILSIGEDYYLLFAVSIVSAVIGSSFLLISLFRGDTVIRILAVLFLLANWKTATEWIEVKPWLPRTVAYPIPPPKVSVIDSRLRVEPRDGYTKVVLVDCTSEKFFYEYRFPGDLLTADRFYRFTLEEAPHHFRRALEQSQNGMITVVGQRRPPEPPDFMWRAEILTVEHDGNVIIDRTICEVHQQRMERRDLPIRSGYPDRSLFPSRSEEVKQFPHGQEYVWGGCCGMPGEETQRGFVCGECVAALKKWRSENPPPTR